MFIKGEKIMFISKKECQELRKRIDALERSTTQFKDIYEEINQLRCEHSGEKKYKLTAIYHGVSIPARFPMIETCCNCNKVLKRYSEVEWDEKELKEAKAKIKELKCKIATSQISTSRK